MVVSFSSCSKDDDGDNNNSYMVGTWKAENDLYGMIEGGTWYTVMEFHKDGSFSNYYQNSNGLIQRRTEDNKFVMTSDSTFTTYDASNNKKMGDYIIYGSNFKPSKWRTSVYYLTFWKQ